MPILHSQFAGQGKTPDGQSIQIPPPLCLMQRGPCVQVSITLADQIASELIKRQESVPAPVSGLALIDTGAISTCIDEETAKQMQLPVVNVVNMGFGVSRLHKSKSISNQASNRRNPDVFQLNRHSRATKNSRVGSFDRQRFIATLHPDL